MLIVDHLAMGEKPKKSKAIPKKIPIGVQGFDWFHQ